MCSPSRRRGRPAHTRPGSSIADGYVTEGASTNAWIVTADGRLVTRQADQAILGGITRSVVLDLLAREGIAVEERPFPRRGGARGRVRPSLPPLRPSSCRSSQSTESRWARASPATIARRLRAAFHDHAEVAPAWSGPRNGLPPTRRSQKIVGDGPDNTRQTRRQAGRATGEGGWRYPPGQKE